MLPVPHRIKKVSAAALSPILIESGWTEKLVLIAEIYLSDYVISLHEIDFLHVLSEERKDINWQALC